MNKRPTKRRYKLADPTPLPPRTPEQAAHDALVADFFLTALPEAQERFMNAFFRRIQEQRRQARRTKRTA